MNELQKLAIEQIQTILRQAAHNKPGDQAEMDKKIQQARKWVDALASS